MKYLLDTNVISHLVKYPDGAVSKRVEKFPPGELGTSIIVSAELRFGYMKIRSKALEKRIERLLPSFAVAGWDAPSDLAYARVRSQLEEAGQPIGQNDMLIAAHAITLGATLVTDNEREFSRVQGLKIENWVRA